MFSYLLNKLQLFAVGICNCLLRKQFPAHANANFIVNAYVIKSSVSNSSPAANTDQINVILNKQEIKFTAIDKRYQ